MMKSCLFVLAALLSYSALHAQVPKGTIQLGPEFGHLSQKQEYANSTEELEGTAISLTAGYAVADNKVLGLSGGIYISDNGRRSTSQNIGAFYRRYYALGQRFAWFIQPSAVVGWQNYQMGKTISITGNFGPGISVFAKSWLQFDVSMPQLFSVYYQSDKESDGFTDTRIQTTGFGLVAGEKFSSNVLRLGARFNL